MAPTDETRGSPAAKRLRRGAALVVAPLLAVLSTWPLARDLHERVAIGPYETEAVTLTTEWTLWWNANRLAHGLSGYWNAPIFAPETGMFALSEPQPLSGLLFSLPYAATGSVEVSYGLVVLFTLALNGWATLRLLCRGGLGLGAATAGSAMVTMLPFVHTELAVLPFITLAGTVAALEAWLSFLDSPSPARAVVLGGALGASYLLSCQLTLLFVVVFALAAPLSMDAAHWKPRVLGSLLGGALACGVLIAPVAAKQLEARSAHHLERSRSTVRGLSAGLNHYVRPPFAEIPFIPAPRVSKSARRWYYPGTLKLVLAAAALYLAVRQRRFSRLLRLASGLLVFALLVGTGPLADFGPVSFYGALARVVPGFRQIRGLFHAAIFVQLAVVVLASAALDALFRSPPARFAEGRGPRAWVALSLLAGALAAVEIWPRGQRFATPPSPSDHRGWIDWVRTHTPETATLAFVPFPGSSKVAAFEPTARWMRLQASFHRPMVNGYSSYFPESNRALAREMKRFPEARALHALRRAQVTTIVVDRSTYDGPRPPLPRSFSDERAGVDVYALGE